MESLVHAMLSNAVAAAGLALIPAVLGLTRAGRSPALIHGLWLLVLIKLVTPPLVAVPFDLPQLARPSPVPVASPPAMAMEPPAPGDSVVEVDMPSVPRDDGTVDDSPEPGEDRVPDPSAAPIDPAVHPRWEGLFLAVVVAGGLVCWGLAAVRISRFRRLLGDMAPAPDELQARVDTLARELNLGRAPTVHLAAGRVPPVLWAFGGQARLLIPAELWPSLPDDQRTALLIHELAHLKRKDHWVRWLDLAVAGLYWWNPIVWWARRAMREAEEQCCDAWAVGAMPRGARTYAAALMAALDFISGAPTVEVAAASAVIGGRRHVSCLQRRMRMIVRAKTPRGLSWGGRLGVLGLAVLILPLAPIRAQDNLPSGADSATDHVTLAALLDDGRGVEAKLDNLVRQLDATIRKDLQQLKAEADDDDDDDGKDEDHKEVADRLERLLKDLGEKLSKDLGPVGEQVVKALERAADEIGEALDKGGIISKDLQEALDRARDELHRAFRSGGQIDQEAREGLEKARQHLSDAVDKAKDDLKDTVRDHAEKAKDTAHEQLEKARHAAREQAEKARAAAREQLEKAERAARGQLEKAERAAREGAERARDELLSETDRDEQEPAREPGAREARAEVERARAEVRRMEQDLRRAMRQLQAIERREARRPRAVRRNPDAPRRGSEDAPKPPVPPAPPVAPEAHPVPPVPPEAPVPPDAPRDPRRARGFRGMGGPPVANPRVERRIRDLEEKLDRLLKELDGLKGEKKEKAEADGDGGEI